MIERVVIDVDRKRVVRLKVPPDQHRSTLCDDVICGGDWVDVQWAPDGSSLAFVSSSRDHKLAELKVADAQTGAVRDVMHELVGTFFESGNGRANWRYLPASNEVIWFSQRERLGPPVPATIWRPASRSGRSPAATWNVTQLLHVDEAGAHAVLQRPWAEKAAATRTSATSTASAWTGEGLRAVVAGRRATTTSSLNASRRVLRRHAGPRRTRRRWPCCATPSGAEVLALERADISRLVGDGLAAADAHHGEGARRRHRPVRAALQADQLRSVAEVSDHQQHLSGTADRQRRQPPVLGGARATPRRWPSSASSSCRSTAWARRGGPSGSTRRTTATWATTRCPTRWPA